jgi:phenylpropionate dioxygenase-like ring-hydroxylating dioxygenase large terminal subunit
MLVICLLAASFTGCLGSDDNTEIDTTIDDETNQEENTKQEEETEQEEELIVPVGITEGNSTTDCVCNCTLIVEDNSYDPEHFSSVFLSNQQHGAWQSGDNSTDGEDFYAEYEDENDFSYYTHFRGFFNKTGNNVHITPIEDLAHTSKTIDANYWYKITIYGPDGLYWQDYVIFKLSGGYLNEIDIELPWEPVGFTLQWTGEQNMNNHGDTWAQPSITRPF